MTPLPPPPTLDRMACALIGAAALEAGMLGLAARLSVYAWKGIDAHRLAAEEGWRMPRAFARLELERAHGPRRGRERV